VSQVDGSGKREKLVGFVALGAAVNGGWQAKHHARACPLSRRQSRHGHEQSDETAHCVCEWHRLTLSPADKTDGLTPPVSRTA
jgi:hypothetical protein